jgi:hypothetical protein
MSKKQKRQVSRTAAPVVREHTEPTSRISEERVAAPAASSRYPVNSSRMPLTTEFNPDYTHVIRDLKGIGVLAGSFIVILVALSFIIK